MGARILKLPTARFPELAVQGAIELERPAARHRFLFWQGASGKRYVHTVYTLIDCPELPAANILLVKSEPDGRRQVLRVGRVEHSAPSLNLADVRRMGASLGANEVHVHLLASDGRQAKVVEFDLRAGQVEDLMGEPVSRLVH